MHNVCSAVSERIIGSGAVTEGKRKLVVDGMVRKAALMQMADAANIGARPSPSASCGRHRPVIMREARP